MQLKNGFNTQEGRQQTAEEFVTDLLDEVKLLSDKKIDTKKMHKLIAEEVRKTNRQMPIYKAVKEFEVRETELIKTTTKIADRKS